jgi:hypothetical protein
VKFAHKSVLCNIEDIHQTIREVEVEWVSALLLRLRLDPERVRRASEDPDYGSQAWRDYLVVEHGLNILKLPDGIVIEKHFPDKPKRVLGEWKTPEIVRIREGDKYHAELRLNYTQLI